LAASEDDVDSDEQIQKSVGRTLLNWGLGIGSIVVIGGWASTGIYQLQPGEAAVILQLGERNRTVLDPGLKWHPPVPIETLEIVNVSEILKESFGVRASPPPPAPQPDSAELGDEDTPARGEAVATFENAMQTADSNIVNLGYVLQYKIDDAFAYLYAMQNPTETLFDATRSAVREVVGQMTVDEVLSSRRKEIEQQASEILRARLREYCAELGADSAFEVTAIRLQVVQPPAQVQQAFDDVIAARQDEERAVSVARGDEREMLEEADAKATELEQSSLAYKETKILEAQGRAGRFKALLAEYSRAPEVTRNRLYLETMQDVLPDVEMMIVETGAASIVPLLSRQSGSPALPLPVAPASAPRSREGAR
jgi:membrane protease subunit HflK